MDQKVVTRERGEERPATTPEEPTSEQETSPKVEDSPIVRGTPPAGEALIGGGEWSPEAVESEPDRQMFWGVATLDSAFSYFTPGARCVSRWAGGFKVVNHTALFVEKTGRGSVFSCTPDEFKLVEEGIRNFVLRPNGMGGADRISTQGRRKTTPEGKVIVTRPYLRQKGDCPLGWFITLVKIPNKDAIPDWSGDELEIRRRTYFKRPAELIDVDIFQPEEESHEGLLKSSDAAFNAMQPPEGQRKVLNPASPKKRLGSVVIEKA